MDGCSSAPSSVQMMKTALLGRSKTQTFLVTLNILVISCLKSCALVPSKITAIPELFTMSKIPKYKNSSLNTRCQRQQDLKQSSSAWKANTFSTSGRLGDITTVLPSKKTAKNVASDFKKGFEQRSKEMSKLIDATVSLQIQLVKWLNAPQIRAKRKPLSVMAGWTGVTGHHALNHVAQMVSRRGPDGVVSHDSFFPRASFYLHIFYICILLVFAYFLSLFDLT